VNLVGALLRSLLTDEQLFQWGWRVAFFTGILVAPVAVFLHVYGAEHNPNEGEFNQEEEADGVGFDSSISSSLLRKHPITEALQRDNWAALFSSFLTPMLAGAGNYITFVWMAVFMQTLLDPPVAGAAEPKK
jgi:MHS family proline/betaine transporter-like MFS transporter